MKAIIIGVVSILLLFLAVYVVRGLFSGAGYVLAAGAAEARIGTYAVGGTGPQELGPYTIHGTAIMDTSNGTPAVPYVKYRDAKGYLAAKQLVFKGVRACAPGAGDYPCVSPYSASDGYPQLTTGEAITVTGYIYENRFLVTSISAGG